MNRTLTAEQVGFYRDNGYLSPLDALPHEKAVAYRRRMEQAERELGPIRKDGKASKSHLLFNWASELVREPAILAALNPLHAMRFATQHGTASFVVLGSVLLAVTGAEALYADMGHFGKRAIRVAWFGLVAPALVLNYFGQGALLLSHPEFSEAPFYRLAPSWGLYPLVFLSTFATVIASQAVISGAFSMTAQAVHLGYAPRMKILYTSDVEIGQIYVPVVNYILLLLVVAVVLAFGKSDNLAAAYGIAVTTTMLLTTGLVTVVMHNAWKWSLPVVASLGAVFLAVDLSFFSANLLKIAAGGGERVVLRRTRHARHEVELESGCDHQAVPRDRGAVGERQPTRPGVDADDLAAMAGLSRKKAKR